MLLTTFRQRSIGSCPSGTQLSPINSCFDQPPSMCGMIESAIFLPLVSVDLEYQDGWCAFKSPRIRVSCAVRRCYIVD